MARAVVLLLVASAGVTLGACGDGRRAPARTAVRVARPLPAAPATAPARPAPPACGGVDDCMAKAAQATTSGDSAGRKRFLAAACAGGSPIGCGESADLARDVDRDDRRAATLYARGCDLGCASCCTNLGLLAAEGRGEAKNEVRAAILYQRACSLGDMAGCIDLGVASEEARGVPRDEGRAAHFYKVACDHGDQVGCSNLGWLYEHGWGVPADGARAVRLYRGACDAGTAIGCTNLGRLHRDGKLGQSRDDKLAFSLFAGACTQQESYACSDLGGLYEEGRGVAADPATALAYDDEGCRLGDSIGCKAAARLRAAGVVARTSVAIPSSAP